MERNSQLIHSYETNDAHLARATLDSLTAHIAILDEDGTILAVNHAWRAFAEANGSTEDFGTGSNYLLVCETASGECSDEAAMTAEGIRAVIAGERELFTLEYPCHSPTELRWYALRVTRFPGAGAARAVVSHENITSRRLSEIALASRVEELFQITSDLERRNQELDQFAYITSHDLKAPLRGIANLSRWIEEDLGTSLTEDVRGHLDLLRGRVTRMEAMIEGILQYSRIGRTQIALEAVSVGDLIDQVVDLLAPPEGMTVTIAPGMPTLVTERVRLEQVFLNLISNAIKYHHRPQEGHIHIGVRDSGPSYDFFVADDGPGIAPQYHEKIFVIFQTLEARDKLESTGVGLALVKKIVEEQHGRVWVESTVGQGATFYFTWPKQSRKEQSYVG